MGNFDSAFTVCLTHDVDRIRKTYQYFTRDLRKGSINNILKIYNKIDPYWNFESIMKIESEFDVRSTFFFLNETIKPNIFSPKSWILAFGRYKVTEPKVIKIIKTLDKGGWEIGLHGSFNSYIDLNLLKMEKDILESVLEKQVIGIRQHHLNLVLNTWKLQQKAGLIYDTTFGFKKDIGFKDEKYEPFHHIESGMVIIPLVIMDINLFRKANNDLQKAWEIAKETIDIAEKKNATLTILWHQRVFNRNDFQPYIELYQLILNECKRRGAQFKTCREVACKYVDHNINPAIE